MSFGFARFWIGWWALLSAGGWALSAGQALHRPGYLGLFALGVVASWLLFRRPPRLRLRHWRLRLRHWLPLGFLLLLGAVLLGGLLYPPNNFDALTYRLPRVLHWLAGEQWHWIHTAFQRLNTRAAACEWAMAPFLLFFGTERWVWLLNAGCLAGLPGLLYATFTRLGVAPRAAYRWMWLLPTGYIFLLQAGGDANDLPGTYFALAALALALRARTARSAGDLLWSAIAIALASGVKASNLPLALPWLLAAAPSWRLLLSRPLLTGLAALLALGSSFLPTAALNVRHCGDWSGQILEDQAGMEKATPALFLTTNLLRLAVQNGTPPVFPFASAWNKWAPRLIPAGLQAHASLSVEAGATLLNTSELPLEDNAGLGPVLPLLLAACAGIRFRHRKAVIVTPSGFSPAWFTVLLWSPWISFAVALMKMGPASAARLFSPYYLFLALPFLVGAASAQATRARWWRVGAALQLLSAGLVLLVTPARPLVPVLTILQHLPARLRESPLIARAQRVYATFRARWDVLAPVRALLPAEAREAGLLVFIEPEASLWRPYAFPRGAGHPRFYHVAGREGVPSSDPAIQQPRYVIVSTAGFNRDPAAARAWVASQSGQVLGAVTVSTLASEPPTEWLVCTVSHPSEQGGASESTGAPAAPLTPPASPLAVPPSPPAP